MITNDVVGGRQYTFDREDQVNLFSVWRLEGHPDVFVVVTPVSGHAEWFVSGLNTPSHDPLPDAAEDRFRELGLRNGCARPRNGGTRVGLCPFGGRSCHPGSLLPG